MSEARHQPVSVHTLSLLYAEGPDRRAVVREVALAGIRGFRPEPEAPICPVDPGNLSLRPLYRIGGLCPDVQGLGSG